MLRKVLRSRLFLVGLLFFVLIVVGGVFYLKPVEHETAEDLAGTQERMKPLTETQKPPTETPVRDTSQDGHFHADGTFHAGPGESEVQEILPTQSESELIHPTSPEADVISPEDHQPVGDWEHDWEWYLSKLDDLNRRFEENSAALRARRITPAESLEFLDRAGKELASIKANLERLLGEPF